MNKKLFKFFLIFFVIYPFITNAQIKNAAAPNLASQEIKIAGYIDYPPFGYVDETNNYHSLFDIMISEFIQSTKTKEKIFSPEENSYQSVINDINIGSYDLLLGAYSNTKLYERVELVFPSIINNPVTIITLQQNADNITKTEQLKNMKGAVCKQDHFTDFVTAQLKEYNLEYIDTPYEMFEKLFTGKVDYLFMTQYYGLIESIKLGLRKKLSFSKQSVWNMPMFLGVSKFSSNRKALVQKFSSYSNLPENKAKIEQKLHEIIQNFEIKYQGAVPPNFSIQENVQQNDILS